MSVQLSCPACATPLRPGKRFCVNCGAPVTVEPAQPFASGGVLHSGLLVQGRYMVEHVLGRGGMGAVYLVRDGNLAGRPCAMKEMLDYSRNATEQEAAIRRFNAEAETLASLSHPGIPQVYDRFVAWSRYYLVMEFVAGVDLNELLAVHLARHNSPLPESEVIRWALQVADVLEYLHGHEPPVVHRDLKPANLILTRSGRVKLVDFGIAKTQSGRQGTNIGTQGYSPPEQYRGLIEPRSDLYALGATLHHLLTGRDPQMQAPFDFPPLPELLPGVTLALSRLTHRLLAMNPADRPASAEEVRDLLAEAFPGVDPYRTRAADRRVADLVARALARKTGEPSQPETGVAAAAASPGAAPATEPGPDTGASAPAQAECPVCGKGLLPEKRFCTQCGTRVSGPLPQVTLRGRAADLALRVPAGFWQRHRVERIEFRTDDGHAMVGFLLGVVPRATAHYAFVAHPANSITGNHDALDVGTPVAAYRQEPHAGEAVFTALEAGEQAGVAEALAAWEALIRS